LHRPSRPHSRHAQRPHYPWLLEHLSDVPRANITLLNQLGTHRPNTRASWKKMLTPESSRTTAWSIMNRQTRTRSFNWARHADGTLPSSIVIWLKPACESSQASLSRTFSPVQRRAEEHHAGLRGLETVMSNHGAKNNRRSAPALESRRQSALEELRDIALRAGPSFL